MSSVTVCNTHELCNTHVCMRMCSRWLKYLSEFRGNSLSIFSRVIFSPCNLIFTPHGERVRIPLPSATSIEDSKSRDQTLRGEEEGSGSEARCQPRTAQKGEVVG